MSKRKVTPDEDCGDSPRLHHAQSRTTEVERGPGQLNLFRNPHSPGGIHNALPGEEIQGQAAQELQRSAADMRALGGLFGDGGEATGSMATPMESAEATSASPAHPDAEMQGDDEEGEEGEEGGDDDDPVEAHLRGLAVALPDVTAFLSATAGDCYISFNSARVRALTCKAVVELLGQPMLLPQHVVLLEAVLGRSEDLVAAEGTKPEGRAPHSAGVQMAPRPTDPRASGLWPTEVTCLAAAEGTKPEAHARAVPVSTHPSQQTRGHRAWPAQLTPVRPRCQVDGAVQGHHRATPLWRDDAKAAGEAPDAEGRPAPAPGHRALRRAHAW